MQQDQEFDHLLKLLLVGDSGKKEGLACTLLLRVIGTHCMLLAQVLRKLPFLAQKFPNGVFFNAPVFNAYVLWRNTQ